MRGPSTSAKIERLLAIIPWVVERGGATVGDIAQRFDLQPDAVYDLLLAAMCYEVAGVGAYENLGIVVFGDESAAGEAWVHVEPGAMLDRPLDLSAPQAFGILVAGQSALALPGADRSGALATALEKLRVAYEQRVRVSVELPMPRSLPILREAMNDGTSVSIQYYTPITDTVTERRVDPLGLTLHDGHWYLLGWCHLRTDERWFRVDRIEWCTDTGITHGREPAAAAPPVEADTAVTVTLSIPKHSLWRVEAYPCLEVTDDNSTGDATGDATGDPERCLVTYDIARPQVLGQMLLRLGADTRVVGASQLPPEMADAGRAAAAAILELYES